MICDNCGAENHPLGTIKICNECGNQLRENSNPNGESLKLLQQEIASLSDDSIKSNRQKTASLINDSIKSEIASLTTKLKSLFLQRVIASSHEDVETPKTAEETSIELKIEALQQQIALPNNDIGVPEIVIETLIDNTHEQRTAGTQTDDCHMALEELRKKLLDLTRRNRLINFKHTRGMSLRVVDELPDQVVERILANKPMKFAPVPEPKREELINAGYISIDPETNEELKLKKEPSAEEWAKYHSIATSHEVPKPEPSGEQQSQHQDDKLQVLLFPYQLESRLRNLTQKANSAIQEMGANILYMSFGFLEWFESRDSDIKNFAPLFLVPINIKKGKLNKKTGAYEYSISYSGEDIIPNLSLREKLRTEFGMELPDLDEDASPEMYFNLISHLIGTQQPRWVVRRYISLALLNFSKLLMYLDLDPNRWPEGSKLCNHDIIRSLLIGNQEEREEFGSLSFQSEYEIDDIPNVHESYPLVFDADSSQHSALKDVIDGKSLVIEGPPGTGKSQTIANIIAAAISRGKKVLFVAEKLAALEVVKRKLDSINLGQFCLELHSHKTQKRLLLDGLNKRIKQKGRFRNPNSIDAEIRAYENYKSKLQNHSNTINTEFHSSGLTLQQILSAGTRFQRELNQNPTPFHPDGFNPALFSKEKFTDYDDVISNFIAGAKGIQKQIEDTEFELDTHPWQGVTNHSLQIFEFDEVARYGQEWLKALTTLLAYIEAFVSSEEIEFDAQSLDAPALEILIAEIQSLPNTVDEELITCLPNLLKGRLDDVDKFLALNQLIDSLFKLLNNKFEASVLQAPEVSVVLKESIEFLLNSAKPSTTCSAVIHGAALVQTLSSGIEEICDPLVYVSGLIEENYGEQRRFSVGALKTLRSFIFLTSSLNPDLEDLRSDLFDNAELDDCLPEIKDRVETLFEIEAPLGEVVLIDSLPEVNVLENISEVLSKDGFFTLFDSQKRAAKKQLLELRRYKKVKFKDLKLALPKMTEYVIRLNELNSEKKYQRILGDLFRGKETETTKLIELRAWYTAVRKQFGKGFGLRSAIGDNILNLSLKEFQKTRNFTNKGIVERIDELLELAIQLNRIFERSLVFKDDSILISGPNNFLDPFIAELEANLEKLDSINIDGEEQLESLHNRIIQLFELNDAIQLAKHLNIEKDVFDDLVQVDWMPNRNIEQEVLRITQIVSLAKLLINSITSKIILSSLKQTPKLDTLLNLIGFGKKLSEYYDDSVHTEKVFTAHTTLDANIWCHNFGKSIFGLIQRLECTLGEVDLLVDWIDYIRAKKFLEQSGLRVFGQYIETQKLPIDLAHIAIRASVYDLLIREIFKEVPDVASFVGFSHSKTQEKFREVDIRLLELQAAKIAFEVDKNRVLSGNSHGKVGEFTELHLLKWEINKKKRHLPIRRLIQRAGSSILALKPCFMMGPMSAAQYLKPGQMSFDLVVMDEASQVKPEDAIGAIARASQVVVVGDPKQLPPTSFFDKLLETDEEDATAIQVSESILDATLPIFPSRRLRWHYRSQHEDLISFSNHSFYDGDLVVFPSPHNRSKEFGVSLTKVKNGKFLDRRNLEEARVIAEAVREHMLNNQVESIGVAAMSSEQREQIQCAIEELAKADTTFSDLIESGNSNLEPLFVKNLENVQGDERDVVLISMTYGPDARGIVMQRFGPINSDVGWRRLNVLFTRSRKRMHIFSSMDAADIRVTDSSSRGVRELKNFLTFAETGLLYESGIETGRLPDSDFEISVAQILKHHGFDCEPQVGAAGFFIDLAVRDPGNPTKFLMGIECDGATYHSAKSARDRDRLRQQVLENLGWNIKRIWSTDWFKNPDKTIQDIVKELEKLKSTPVEIQEKLEDLALKSVTAEIEEEDISIDSLLSENVSLRDMLTRFDREVVLKDHPNTPDEKRLLRSSMIEAILEFQPINLWEFQEHIPPYLRSATDPKEGKYLPQIFELVQKSLENGGGIG